MKPAAGACHLPPAAEPATIQLVTSPGLRVSATDPGGRAAPDAGPRIAALDIGSNSIRQIGAEVGANGPIRVVDEMKAAPRLGAGLRKKSSVISDAAMDQALEALGR